MARQTGPITFTGKLGNLVGYYRNGVYFLRRNVDGVRQTPATRKAAQHFGTASTKGRLIRSAFIPQLDVCYEGTMVNRLTKTLVHTGSTKDPDSIEGFRFNKHATLDKFFRLPPIYKGPGEIHIPAQTILRPQHTTHLHVKLVAARIDFINRKVIATRSISQRIDLHAAFTGLTLHADIPGPGTCILVLQVQDYKNEIPREDRLSIAADIVAFNRQQPTTPARKTARRKPVTVKKIVRNSLTVHPGRRNRRIQTYPHLRTYPQTYLHPQTYPHSLLPHREILKE
ncbi:hypothetical protein KTO58_15235 [Chitinophaga pendula]|uniref:hypothetical protein n=1 Tax=Chitinophaga TaxID=79328 RepID=UPI000BAE6B4B|nr:MULTISPECIES: hypothetical protein [Chitinophaga]ASZ11923.1 hypothetical protein CK934_13620 [Chitinophaga sp. MD30]UCJ05050.1 hypothetical protein KTO58_15235 [Chitinophaga pendula]